MADHAVVIAGGGPTGLMLAGELALADVDVAIVERRATQDLEGPRAKGLHARTIEMLDLRGIAERFLEEGYTAQVAGYAWFPLDISDFPTRHSYGLALGQAHVERILAGWVQEMEVPIYRQRVVTGLDQDDTGVNVTMSDGRTMRAEYLVGCDGGRSIVRKTAGFAFPGWDASMSNLLAEVYVKEQPVWGPRRDAKGVHSFSRTEGSDAVTVLVTEQRTDHTAPPSLDDLREALNFVYGTDYGVHNPVWISRFTDLARQAESYRKSRVILAGDAAHVHYPTGGQGLNTGMQDAMNLGWKLARVVKGKSPNSLLDTYTAERHPVAAAVLRNTMAQVALLRSDDRTDALREAFSQIISMEEPRKTLAAMICGLGIRYGLGEGHPLRGLRMPDLDITTDEGSRRVSSLLHDAKPVLLNLNGATEFDITPWTDQVRSVIARYDGAWDLPVIGVVPSPAGVLIRPDGYVAWAGEGGDRGLADAMTTWVGAPVHTMR